MRKILRIIRYMVGADFVPYNPVKRYGHIFKKENKILDIGSGNKEALSNVVNMDISKFENVDVVADGANLPFGDNVFDTVVTETTLEHVKSPGLVLSEIKRCLKSNGYVFAVIPFVCPYHGFPFDYQRYSADGIKVLFKDFEQIEIGIYRGPSVALVNFLSDYLSGLFLIKNAKIRIVLKSFFTLFIFPIKFLDVILNKFKSSFECAHCFYFIGKILK